MTHKWIRKSTNVLWSGKIHDTAGAVIAPATDLASSTGSLHTDADGDTAAIANSSVTGEVDGCEVKFVFPDTVVVVVGTNYYVKTVYTLTNGHVLYCVQKVKVERC